MEAVLAHDHLKVQLHLCHLYPLCLTWHYAGIHLVHGPMVQ
jgi:hypothetical protein